MAWICFETYSIYMGRAIKKKSCILNMYNKFCILTIQLFPHHTSMMVLYYLIFFACEKVLEVKL